MPRESLPERRINCTVKVQWKEHTFYLTVGFYDSYLKRPGEIFADSGKTSETVQQLVKDACVIISLALQYGVPPVAFSKSIPRYDDGRPYTIIGTICDLLEKADWEEENAGV